LAFHSGGEADHSPPFSAEVEEWVELYLHSPTTPSWRGAQGEHRDNFLFFMYIRCYFLLPSSLFWLLDSLYSFIVLFLCLISYNHEVFCKVKACWRVDIKLHAFLTSALDGGEWSASRPWYQLDRRLGGS
jgi:hypothetical protein